MSFRLVLAKAIDGVKQWLFSPMQMMMLAAAIVSLERASPPQLTDLREITTAVVFLWAITVFVIDVKKGPTNNRSLFS